MVLTNEMLVAEIRSSSQRGLNGGMTEIKISGIPRLAIEQLLSEAAPQDDAFLVGTLHLHWRGKVPLPGLDVAISALQSATDAAPTSDTLSTVFAITRLVPEVEQVRYALILSGPNAIFHALSTRRLNKQLHAENGPALAAEIVKSLGASPEAGSAGLVTTAIASLTAGVGSTSAASVSVKGLQSGAGGTGTNALESVAESVASVSELGVLLPFLLRDDRILIGKDVLSTFKARPRELTAGSGIIAVSPRALGAGEASSGYTLLLRGDPKIKPGDVVKFAPPVPKGGLPGTGLALADNVMAAVESITGGKNGDDVLMLVDSVTHTYRSRTGFTTEAAGVLVTDNSQPPQQTKTATSRVSSATPAGESAAAIQSKFGSLMNRASLDIAEVRSFAHVASPPLPGQSSQVIYGLGPRGEHNNALRQVDVDRKSGNQMGGVAYLTPFAWGPFGQVLPRYPGTRVLLGSRGGASDDTVDLGALWWSGEGSDNPGPRDVEPGDYWLLLPIEPDRIPSSGTEAITPGARGASHDLTNIEGQRVLQVSGLTVRIGAITTGDDPIARPKASEDAVAIEVETTSGSAKFVIKPNGDIEMTSGGKLKLSSRASIDIEAVEGISVSSSKDIKLKASNSIELSVGGTSLKVKPNQVEIE